jgi:hypothetical protein
MDSAYTETVYRVQFYCPRSGKNYWQTLTGFLWQPRTFPTQEAAQQACDQLLWQYHSARVIDPWGNVVYQV